MDYSIDLRKSVVSFISKGGSQTEASATFGVSRKTIYNWLNRPNLSPTVRLHRKRKLDKSALSDHIRDYPDALLRERAVHFNVSSTAIWKSLRRMNIVKKNDEIFSDKSQ